MKDMKRIKSIGWWCLLLQKRFLKKYIFLLILAMIPLLTLGMRFVAGKEKGMVSIVVAMEEPEEATIELGQTLFEQAGVLQLEQAASGEAAIQKVRAGEADAAWIIREGYLERLQAYVDGNLEDAPIRVVEREENIALQLAREKLYSAAFRQLSFALYEQFIRKELGDAAITEEALKKLYEDWTVTGSLVQYEVLHSDKTSTGEAVEVVEEDYLLSPVRGLLALFVLACGLACSMYYLQDEEAGIFSWMPLRHPWWLEVGYHLIAIADAVLFLLLGLFVLGDLGDLGRELLVVGLYAVMVAAFSMIVRRLCGSIPVLGAMIPVLLLGMLVLCPIFISMRQVQLVRYLLPPFYYLSAGRDCQMLVYMGIYTVVLCVISYGIQSRKR